MQRRNSHLTVGIGTQGYRPLEQRAGKPRFNSDIYAVGMTAIQALTGIPPEKLPEDTETEEVRWRGQANVSDRLANILDTMVKLHFRDRYQSVGEILQDLDSQTHVQSAKVAPQSSSRLVGGSTVISRETRQQAVTAKQPSVVSNTVPDEPNPKRSFGFAIALAVMGAVAATLGVTQLISFLRSKPANQPVAQTPTQPIPAPIETSVDSPSSLPLATPQVSPSTIASATPKASPVAIPAPETTEASSVAFNSQNSVPLIDTKCLTTTAAANSESFVKGPEDVTIGQEVVTAVAFLRGRANYVSKDSAAGVACLIASPDSSAQFRKLRLSFGISNTNNYTGTVNESAVLGLTVYLDRKKIVTKEVKRGEKQFWEIDVANARNVALEAECVKPKLYYEPCPSVVFTQAELK